LTGGRPDAIVVRLMVRLISLFTYGMYLPAHSTSTFSPAPSLSVLAWKVSEISQIADVSKHVASKSSRYDLSSMTFSPNELKHGRAEHCMFCDGTRIPRTIRRDRRSYFQFLFCSS
jgi:hypothetical protein